ncbi:MAG: hypothetical protein Q4D94_07600 [Bacillota bacterium]|nr:hypothetical protein [Bacillota bacterium]
MEKKGCLEIASISRSLLALIVASAVFASGAVLGNGELGNPRSSYGLGSAKYLKGSNLLYSLFVDTPASNWNLNEMEQTLTTLNSAAIYIEETAKEYHAETELVCDWQMYSDLTERVKVDFEIMDDEDFEDRLDQEIALWVEELVDYEYLMEKYEAEGIALLVFVNNPGTSYAIVYDGEDNPRESIVLFGNETPATYAHEILHVFGAHDLYRDGEYTVEAAEYIKSAYPLEIMRTVTDENGRTYNDRIVNNISPITAYHLGWIDDTEEIHLFPELKRKGV